MQTARGFFAGIMVLIAIAVTVVALDALSDSRMPEVGTIKALLCALIVTVVLAALYVGTVIDGLKPKAVQAGAQGQPQGEQR